jgi:WD40 repeat protein
MCLHQNGTVFVGTKTNQIVQIEEKETKVIVDGHDGDIWGLATHPEKDLFVTGAYDNAVKLWDANTLKCIQTHEFELEVKEKGKGKKGKGTGKEIVTAAWSNNGKCIVFGTEDSNIAIFSFNNETNKFKYESMVKIPKKNKNAEEENISYLRFSSDSKYLAVAHMDSQLYIFKVLYGKSGAVKFDGKQKWKPFVHPAAPTHIQWSEDGKMLKT